MGTTISRCGVEVSWADHEPWPALDRIVVGVAALAVLFARFGIPDVPLMWPEHRLGLVAPTCGLTRAVVALARLDPGRAWAFNPLGFVVAAVGTLILMRLAFGVVRRRWLTVSVRAPGWLWVLALGVSFGGLGAWQQAHAAFIIHHLR